MKYWLTSSGIKSRLAAGIIAAGLGMSYSIAIADQRDPTLDILFDNLRTLEDRGDIEKITAEIWTRWSHHQSDETLTNRLKRGVVMMNQGDYLHAEALFTDVIESDPEFAEAWNKRATLYFFTGRFDESRADIAQTLAIEPRHFGALSGLGLLELHLQNFEAALRAYEEAAMIHPHLEQVNEMIENLKEKIKGIAL